MNKVRKEVKRACAKDLYTGRDSKVKLSEEGSLRLGVKSLIPLLAEVLL
jgi:hypothetical protein